MSEIRMFWEDELAEDIESRRACMRAAAVEAYAAAAALCREEGCACIHLGDYEVKGGASDDWQEVVRHNSRCPHALAARIEALGKTEPQSGGR